MAHFAEIGVNNKVIRVVVVNNDVLLDVAGVEQESLGAEFCRNLLGGTWVQTSYNGNIRARFAGEAFIYNDKTDEFELPNIIADDNDTAEIATRFELPNIIADDNDTAEIATQFNGIADSNDTAGDNDVAFVGD